MRHIKVASFPWVLFFLITSISCLCLSVSAAEKFVVGIAPSDGLSPEMMAFWERVVLPEFNKIYPNLKVEFRYIGYGKDQLTVQYAGGNAPDVVQFGTNSLASIIPMLEPLNAFMQKNNIEDIQDFVPGSLRVGYAAGKQYGIPFTIATRAFVYRQDMFERAGLDPSRGPDTWEELLTYARKLTTRTPSGEIEVEGINVKAHRLDFSPWVLQAGGQYVSDDETRSEFASPAMEMALKFAQDLHFAYKVAAKDSPGFEKRRSAMGYSSGSALIDPDLGPVVGLSLPPKKIKRTTVISADTWGIINTSKHKDAAWTWIRIVSSKSALGELVKLNKIVPPRRSLAAIPPWSKDRRMQALLETASIATPLNGRSLPRFDLICGEIITPTLYRIIYEGLPVRNELEKASKQIDQIIQEDLKKK